MKLGAYVKASSVLSGSLVVHELPGSSSRVVEHLVAYAVVRVLAEEEYLQKSDEGRYSWWWVPVMTMNHKVGWVIFCHGIEKKSHFEYCGK